MNKIYIYTGVLLICGLIGLLVYFLIKPPSKPIVSPKCKKGASMIGGTVKGCFCGIAEGETTSFENATDNCRHNKKQCSQLDDSECDGGKCWQVSQSICDNTKPPYFPPISKCESTGNANSLYPGLDACFCSKPINSNLSKSPGLALDKFGNCYPCLSGQNKECEYQAGPGSQCLYETCTKAPACIVGNWLTPTPDDDRATMPWRQSAGCFCGKTGKPDASGSTGFTDAAHNCTIPKKPCPQASSDECEDGEMCYPIPKPACGLGPWEPPFPQPQVCKVQFTTCEHCDDDGSLRQDNAAPKKVINCFCQSSQKCCNGDCSKLCQPPTKSNFTNPSPENEWVAVGGGCAGCAPSEQSRGNAHPPLDDNGMKAGGSGGDPQHGGVPQFNGVCTSQSWPQEYATSPISNDNQMARNACAMTSGKKDPNGSPEPMGDCAVLCASLQCTKTRNGTSSDLKVNVPNNAWAKYSPFSNKGGDDPNPAPSGSPTYYQTACTQNCGPIGSPAGACSEGSAQNTPKGAFAYCVPDDSTTKTSNEVGGWSDDGEGKDGFVKGVAGFCYNSIAPTCDDTYKGTMPGGLCFDIPDPHWPNEDPPITGKGFRGRAMLPSLPNNLNGPPSGSRFPEVLPWPTDDQCCKDACQGSRNPDDPSTCLQRKFGPNENTCVQK